MLYHPSEEAIKRVMEDLKLERMQAIYHLRSLEQARRRKKYEKQYPLGKSFELA